MCMDMKLQSQPLIENQSMVEFHSFSFNGITKKLSFSDIIMSNILYGIEFGHFFHEIRTENSFIRHNKTNSVSSEKVTSQINCSSQISSHTNISRQISNGFHTKTEI